MKIIFHTIIISVWITIATIAITWLNNFIKLMPESDFWSYTLGILAIVVVIFVNHGGKIIERFS